MVQTDRIMYRDPVTTPRVFNSAKSVLCDPSQTEPFIVRADGKERLLTPIEHAIVKSIPTRLVPEGGITIAHQILGQSVDYLQPYKLVRSVMDRIRPILQS